MRAVPKALDPMCTQGVRSHHHRGTAHHHQRLRLWDERAESGGRCEFPLPMATGNPNIERFALSPDGQDHRPGEEL